MSPCLLTCAELHSCHLSAPPPPPRRARRHPQFLCPRCRLIDIPRPPSAASAPRRRRRSALGFVSQMSFEPRARDPAAALAAPLRLEGTLSNIHTRTLRVLSPRLMPGNPARHPLFGTRDLRSGAARKCAPPPASAGPPAPLPSPARRAGAVTSTPCLSPSTCALAPPFLHAAAGARHPWPPACAADADD